MGTARGVAEPRTEFRRGETGARRAKTASNCQNPPVEWVAERVRRLQEVLERETGRSALLLRGVLGPVRLRPVAPQIGKAYYQAETTLQVLDLLHDPEGGSNWLRQWRRGGSNPRPKGPPRARLRV